MTNEFNERLKAARDLRRISQAELAARAGVTPSSISHFEAGARKPSMESLRRLATALSVSADYLIGLSDTPGGGSPSTPMHRLSADDLELARGFVDLLIRRSRSDRKSRPKAAL